ncbi:hypothetical protein SacglDRAFT_04123 [Saccharomonospora glauca K62]|uniref:Uncharacterized protein n=1 Tax=Saccharomonospora glauca K62 TaxID=928724 RepID=I1D7N0_9PSEU|nr:hypothetical protein SacglDRAFT_04123 [Saccharomonospora glauca K62]
MITVAAEDSDSLVRALAGSHRAVTARQEA